MSDDEMTEVQAGPVVKVARDLTEILAMIPMLDEQAEHKANARIDGTGLPGGMAMVTLAPVANLEAWANRHATAERLGADTSWVEDEDGDWEPVLQTLMFWSEQWRAEHGNEYGQRPTIHTEANYIRACLDWAWERVPEWDDFATDIRRARVRMENVLYAGERAQRGAPCLYDECKGARLVRKHVPCRDEDGNKAWRWSDWHCPKCKRSWDDERYIANVAAAHWSAQAEEIDGDLWCSVKYASRQTGVPETTIRAWVSQTKKGERPIDLKHPIGTACLLLGRRIGFVCLREIETRRDRVKRRAAA